MITTFFFFLKVLLIDWSLHEMSFRETAVIYVLD